MPAVPCTTPCFRMRGAEVRPTVEPIKLPTGIVVPEATRTPDPLPQFELLVVNRVVLEDDVSKLSGGRHVVEHRERVQLFSAPGGASRLLRVEDLSELLDCVWDVLLSEHAAGSFALELLDCAWDVLCDWYY